MNPGYEKFLIERNPYDQQVCLAPHSDHLLSASVRRHVGTVGPAKAAGDLYRLADLIAVRGIDDTPAPPPPSRKEPPSKQQPARSILAGHWPASRAWAFATWAMLVGSWIGYSLGHG